MTSKINSQIVNDDYEKADEIIEYFEGLIFKAMQRDQQTLKRKLLSY